MQGVSDLATTTQTVFGAGAARAPLMLIGEQPGAQEDIQGKPFVGPAGQLLRQLLDQAGIGPGEVYPTNTVKHFKYEPPGKARLHKRADAAEHAACRPWLAAELLRITPRVIVCLGALAAQTLFGRGLPPHPRTGRLAHRRFPCLSEIDMAPLRHPAHAWPRA